MKNRKILVSIIALLIFNGILFAEEFLKVGITQGFEFINGHIYEGVFYTPDSSTTLQESLLDWEVVNIPAANFNLNAKIYKYIDLDFDLVLGLDKISGRMQDYDWLNVTSTGTDELTNYSIHENHLNTYHKIFFTAGSTISLTDKFAVKPYASIGKEYISFTGLNGYKQYGKKNGIKYKAWNSVDSEGNPEYTVGEYSGKVISYEQNIYYYGLGLGVQMNFVPQLESKICFEYYPFNSYLSYDIHHKRTIPTQFADQFDNKTVISFKQNTSYSFNDNIKIGFTGWLIYMPQAMGPTYKRSYDITPGYSYISDWTKASSEKGSTERFLYSFGCYLQLYF